LAMRNFRVVLFEKAAALGGTLNVADKPAFKDKLTLLTETMQVQLERLGVEIRCGVEATPELVAQLSPAGVIVACGARPMVPPLPGVDSDHVCLAEDVILGKVSPSGNVAVIGSGLTGLETSEMLLSRGLKVSIVEMAAQVGPGIFGAILNDELSRITPHDPAIYVGHKLVSIQNGSIILEKTEDGSKVEVAADSVVLALGVRPRSDIVASFRGAFDKVVAVGDARQGGRIASAIREGYEAAYVFEA